MKRLLLVALVALAAASAASADPLPSADAPNVATPLAPQLLVQPAQPEVLTYDQLLPLWQAAGQAYGIPWAVLAAINKVESNFGENMGPSSAGAIGWMQFMPDTWARWGTDANGDGIADPWSAEDAIYSAARYLAASGGATDIRAAVFSYNHAWWYVDEVLQLAQDYDSGGVSFSNQLDNAQQALDAAKKAVVDANQRLLDAQARLDKLQAHEDVLTLAAQNAATFTARLNAQKDATLFDVRLQAARADVDARTTELQQAQDALTAARDGTASTAFTPGAGQLLGAPAYSTGYVFPVGGGPGVVSVGHTHHDYPAADIAAPEGTQLYALSDGVIERSWADPDPSCGIGFTIHTTDGLTWTYCHMSYLEPAVVAGATLSAGQPVGLVGQTGDASGPHLHLQLQPATGYPQDEPWFQAFAGTAFTWSDSVQHNPAQTPVFSVVGADRGTATRALDSASSQGPVIFFTASGA
jgi:murein DD-endopeptidase MepM/ murein hydrolase activator NlpD